MNTEGARRPKAEEAPPTPQGFVMRCKTCGYCFEALLTTEGQYVLGAHDATVGWRTFVRETAPCRGEGIPLDSLEAKMALGNVKEKLDQAQRELDGAEARAAEAQRDLDRARGRFNEVLGVYGRVHKAVEALSVEREG